MAEIIDEPAFRNRVDLFDDRLHAGELLARKLMEFRANRDVYTLAIPAGGVQVAFVVAKKLRIPMDLAITRKIHVPWNKEAGFGAVSWDGLVLLNEPLVATIGLTEKEIQLCVAEEKKVIRRRDKIFRGGRPFPDLKGKTVIVVDDGLASGYSMLTTLKSLGKKDVKKTIVAVPTSSLNAIKLIKSHTEKVICLNVRSGPFFAVADAYKTWYDLKDEDVVEILRLVV